MRKILKIYITAIFLLLSLFNAVWAQEAKNQKEQLPLPVRLEERAMQSLRRGKILLNFENANIRVVAKLIAELTRKNIIMDDRVNGRISILSSQEVTPKEAWKMFITALNAYGYDVVDWGTTAKIVPIKTAKTEKARFYSEDGVARGEDYLVAVVALKNANPDLIAATLRNLLTEMGVVTPYVPSKCVIIADDAYNVRRLIKIAKHLDVTRQKPIFKSYCLKNSVSTEVVKILEEIYKPTEGNVIISDYPSHNSVVVFAPNHLISDIENYIKRMDQYVDLKDQTRKFRVIQLQNARAEDVAKILSEMLQAGEKAIKDSTRTTSGTSSTQIGSQVAPSGTAATSSGSSAPSVVSSTPGTPDNPSSAGDSSRSVKSFISTKVSSDEETNSVVLYATDAEMEEILPMIAKLDAKRKQVLVTAVIAEVTLKRSHASGANWQILQKDKIGASFGGGQSLDSIYQLLASGNFVLGGVSDESTTITVSGKKLVFPNIFAFIQFLNEDNDFNILSTPRVLTLDNKEATMNVGSIIPFATGVKFDTNNQPVVTYDYKDIGLNLTVTPHIGQGKLIRMEVKQKIQDVTDYLQQNVGAVGYVVPVVSTRNVETTINIGDSQTIIIGGLVSKKMIDSIKKVPLLGDIPIIGTAFKNRTKEEAKTTLFIFLTPHIVEDPRDLNKITDTLKTQFEKESVLRYQDVSTEGENSTVRLSPDSAEETIVITPKK